MQSERAGPSGRLCSAVVAWLAGRSASFRFAFRGLAYILRTQKNARIHLAATVLVVAAGLRFGVDRWEWCWLLFAIGWVWVAEAFNTAIETLVDAGYREPDPLAGQTKDASAAAVLLAAAGAVLIALFVFVPRVLNSEE